MGLPKTTGLGEPVQPERAEDVRRAGGLPAALHLPLTAPIWSGLRALYKCR